MIYSSMLSLVGNTPMVRLNRLKDMLQLKSELLLKLESFNPAGSAKDRVALEMINDLEAKGVIDKDTVLIEPTSGNTGIGIAFVAAIRGYKAVIVMPDTMSTERIRAITAYGAQVVLSKGSLGMKGAIEKAEEVKAQIGNAYILGQFTNSANPLAHYNTTGPEIWRDTNGKVDYFVAGIGTGGTVSGAGRFLKEMSGTVTVIGVEPAESPLLTKNISGAHKIQGIGANFVPDTLDVAVPDAIVTVSGDDAYKYARLLAHYEGILAGISAGAAFAAGVELALSESNKNIVVLLPDHGDRYYSTGVFDK